jgi:hypothetical protein
MHDLIAVHESERKQDLPEQQPRARNIETRVMPQSRIECPVRREFRYEVESGLVAIGSMKMDDVRAARETHKGVAFCHHLAQLRFRLHLSAIDPLAREMLLGRALDNLLDNTEGALAKNPHRTKEIRARLNIIRRMAATRSAKPADNSI